ncbi:MAG: hypothetical protein MUF53_06720, partial [Gemmatimonadaceae bacterium]|nr:hypothetical protein [Gemmatimonadaceae bacterium]
MPARLAPFRAAALRHFVLPAVLCTAPHALGAQAPSAAAAPAAAAPRVTRADLAAAYQRVDAWVIAHPLDSATAVHANRLFDQSTLQFFAGRGAEAVRALNRLAAGLQGDTTADGDLV